MGGYAFLHIFSGFFCCTSLDRKSKKSSTRSSVTFAKAPSRHFSKKNIVVKERNAGKSLPGKKGDYPKKDQSEEPSKNRNQAESSTLFATSGDARRLDALKQHVDDLQKKLSEKDELLKAAEKSLKQMSLLQKNYDHLRRYAAEKESLIRSIQLDLSDAKMKLSKKQAALETTQWEAMTSNQMVERLQDEITSLQSKMSSVMLLVEGLREDDPVNRGDYDVMPYSMDPVPGIDDMEENEMLEMEEARQTYLAAVAVAKEKKDEESLRAAAATRLYLQSFVFKSTSD